MYTQMINTIRLLNTTTTSHSYFYVCVVRTFKVYTLSNFQVYSTVLLTTVTMLYIWLPVVIHLIVVNFLILSTGGMQMGGFLHSS